MPLSPLQIPGCVIWLDAEDDSVFSYSSGVLVSQWRDKSPSAYHFPHPTPTYQPSRNTTRNGRKTVNFSGGQVLEQAAAAPFTNTNATIFAVLCETGAHRDYAGFLAARVTAGNDYDQAYAFDLNNGEGAGPTNLFADRASSGGKIAGAAPTPFSVHTITLTPSAITPYRNGVVGVAGGAAGGGAAVGLIMGCRWLAAAADLNYGMRGEWAEFIAYNRILTTDERIQIQDALYAKWITPQANQQYLDLSETVTPWEDLRSTGSVVINTPLAPQDNVDTEEQLVLSTPHTLDLADSVAVSDLASIGFDPTSISGLKLWFDASILTPGAAISAWANRAPAGVGLTAVSSPAPVVSTPQAGQNGNPVLRFSSTGGGLKQAAATGVDKDHTLIAVVRMWGATKARLFGGETPTINFLVGYHANAEDVCFMNGWFTNANGDGTGPTATTNWKMYSTDGSTSVLPRLFSNGVKLADGVAGWLGWTNTFTINQYAGQLSDSEVAEVVQYNRKLSDAERQQVENYLRIKWLTPGNALTLGPSDGLADTVAPTDTLATAQDQTISFTDTATTSDALGLEVSLTFSDGVNTSDELVQPFGAFWEVTADDSVGVSDLLGIAVGEYIIPCRPDPVVGSFKAGESVAGTWFVCAKKGILGLGAYVPVLERHDLAASPAGLGLGTNSPNFVGQPATTPGGTLGLGAYAPGFSLKLTPPLGGLRLYGRVPLNVGLEPPIYPAGLILGGEEPVFAGREPPVVPAGLGLVGIVPGFKFSHRLPAPSAGLALGGGPPVQVEAILIISSEPHPIDLLPVPVNGEVLLSTGTPVSVDLLSTAAQPVTLGDVDSVPADLNEVECV